MTVQISGDVDERLVQGLKRRLNMDVATATPGGANEFVHVLAHAGLSQALLDDARVSLIVLVEPSITQRDAALRALAARARPGLEIVEHVSAGIQAERTWALLQSLALDISRLEQRTRQAQVRESHLVEAGPAAGNWASVEVGRGLAGLTIGFIGFGPLAHRLAHRASHAGLRIRFWPQHTDRSYLTECEGAALRTGAQRAAFDDVLSESDIVVLDLEYGPESVRIIDAPELALMRPDALLVNTSHGRAIDEGALIQTLRSEHLAGTALDRFNYEPLPHDSPLRGLESALLTPGIAVPDETTLLDETARQIADAIALRIQGVELRRVHRRPRRRAQP